MKKDPEIKDPCKLCPYRLGMIKTLVSPCPTCAKVKYSIIKKLLASYNKKR